MSTTAATSGVSQVSIRAARREDADTVFALLKQLAESYAPVRAAFDETFKSFLDDDPSVLLLVAEDAEGVVRGYALTTINRLLYTNGRSAQLQELVVDDNARGRGIGTLLIETLEEACRARDVKQLTVPSRRSADFYERLGYRSTADFLKRTFD
jgi:N-acetylglutamate synthase-like GNAT family acetyltransferase